MQCLRPAATEIAVEVNVPRASKRDLKLVDVTEVSERAVYAMYDAMRGAAKGAQKTAPSRKRAA